MPHLALTLLGRFDVSLDGQPIVGLTSRKAQALLAYLAVEAVRSHRREMLAALLWPELPDREALRKLRYTIFDLRQAMGGQASAAPLLISRNAVRLNLADSCDLDVARFQQQLAAAGEPASPGAIDHLHSAIGLFRGSFLEEFSVDSPAFEEWVLLKRQHLHWQLMSALHQLAELHEARGEYDQAQACARRQLELEPWREEAHRQLMRILALSGERSLALTQFRHCARCLKEEFGVAPEEQTVALYEAIRDGRLSDPATSRLDAPVASRRAADSQPARESAAALFVDRTRELAKLERALGAALAGRGQVVFIAGEAGSGKTALAMELARRAMATHDDLLVAIGQCHAGGADAYLPFREIVQMLAGDYAAKAASGAISNEHASRLWQASSSVLQDLLDHSSDLIDSFVSRAALLRRAAGMPARGASWRDRLEALPPRQAPGWALGGPGANDQLRIQPNQQVAAVLFALARRRPLLLFVDDLHWADSGTIGLLAYLSQHLAGSRTLIVGAYQPAIVATGHAPWRYAQPGAPAQTSLDRHPLEALVHELQRRGAARVDLDQADGRQFTADFLESEPNRLDAGFREALYRHTAGNPLFIVALLSSMKASGALARDSAGRWVAGAASTWGQMPPQVESAIAERIDRLPPAWQAMLTIASVEGEEFTAELIARVQGVDVALPIGALSKQHGLIYSSRLDWAGAQRLSRYRFRHGLVQQYLYNRLDMAERARLHEAVGQALEVLYGPATAGLPAVASQLDRHYRAAGLAELAVSDLRQVGRQMR